MSKHTYTRIKQKKRRRKTDRLMRTMTVVLTHTCCNAFQKKNSNGEKETMKRVTNKQKKNLLFLFSPNVPYRYVYLHFFNTIGRKGKKTTMISE
jgi:hypothetical protein